MEFAPAFEVYQHAAARGKAKPKEFEFRVDGWEYCAPYTDFENDIGLILEAIRSVFIIQHTGDATLCQTSDIYLSRIARKICVKGRAPELLNAVRLELQVRVLEVTKHLLLRCTANPGSELSITAAVWQHVFQAILFVSKILLYADKKYMSQTPLKSWRQYCIGLFNGGLASEAQLFSRLLEDIVQRLRSPREQELQALLDGGEAPLDQSLIPDIRTVVLMMLDLERYDGMFIKTVIRATSVHYTNLTNTFKSATSKPAGVKLATYLATAIVQESYRFKYYFHESSEKEALQAILTQFLINQGEMFVGFHQSASLEPITYPQNEDFAVPVIPHNALIDIVLQQEDALLQLTFIVFQQAKLFEVFADAWCRAVLHLVKSFLEHYLQKPAPVTYESMPAKQKLKLVTALVTLTDSMSRRVSTTLSTNHLKPVFDLEGTDTEDGRTLVEKAKECILSNFNLQDDSLQGVLQTRTREAFTSGLNASHQQGQILARCFVFYTDYIFQHGLDGAGEPQFRVMLKRLIVLFRSLEAKILIGTLHEAAMAQRIFPGRSRAINMERLFVQLLSEECGEAFVQRMQFILAEHETSQSLARQFARKGSVMKTSDSDEFRHCDFKVIVVPTQAWPKKDTSAAASSPSSELGQIRRITEIISYDHPVPLPPQIVKCNEAFTSFYRELFENRVLRFMLNDSSATMRFAPHGSERSYQLAVTAFQALVLLQFNSNSQVAKSDLLKFLGPIGESGLAEDTLSSLHSDSSRQILILTDNDIYTVNHEFKSLKPQIPMKNLAAKSKVDREGFDSANSQSQQTRTEQVSFVAIEAFIVRYLKKQKTATFNEIYTSLVAAHLGVVMPPDVVRGRLQHLINKDFLSSSATDVFEYEA